MYKRVIRPILFLMAPERVHHLTTGILRFLFSIPGIPALFRSIYTVKDPRLHREFLGMKFDSPVGLAAGFDKNGEVFNIFHQFGFSHVEVGTVTPKGQPGNPKPRSFRIPKDKGLINRMGFNNHGLEALHGKLSGKRNHGLIIGGNIGKNTATSNEDAVADYEASFRRLYDVVDYFVVNVSCPNISDLHELADQEGLEAILGRLAAIRGEQPYSLPILLKIAPDLNDAQIDTSMEIVKKFGIDGIVATNTTISREGLSTPEEKIKAIGQGWNERRAPYQSKCGGGTLYP